MVYNAEKQAILSNAKTSTYILGGPDEHGFAANCICWMFFRKY
jgi:hypothetical protein